MLSRPRACALSLPALLLAAAAPPGRAAGVLLGDGGRLSIEDLRARVVIEDGVAVTEVEEVFRNDADAPVEAVWAFPLPARATLTGLSIWVDGQEVPGEVVAAARARRAYAAETGVELSRAEEVRRPREALGERAPTAATRVGEAPRLRAPRPVLRPHDPALLERVAGNALALRVAPVPARGTQRVRIRWVEPARLARGVGGHVLPLALDARLPLQAAARRDPSVSPAPAAGRLFVEVVVASSTGLGEVRCPTHADVHPEALAPGVAWQARYEAADAPLDRDLVLAWDVPTAPAPTVTVAAAPGAGGGPATALLTLVPWFEGAGQGPSRDVLVLLDATAPPGPRRTAGLTVARAALAAVRPQDRLAAAWFDLGARTLAAAPAPATAAARAQAQAFLGAQGAAQGDLRAALEAAARVARRGGRPLDVVLVAQAGSALDPALVTPALAAARAAGVRVLALEVGAGREARRPLEALARATGGVALALADGDDPRAAAATLVAALEAPVLRDPRLSVEGVTLEHVHPALPPPVLVAGSAVTLAGRYARPGEGRLVLEGTLADGRRGRWVVPLSLPAAGRHPDVTRLWGQARSDDLEVALAAPGLAARRKAGLAQALEHVEVQAGILGRTTALLALQDEAMYARHGLGRENRERLAAERAADDARAADLAEAIEARRAALAADDDQVLAEAPRGQAPVWRGPSLGGGFGGGGGGGAGEPVLLLLAGAAAWSARRRAAPRRAAA